MGNWLAKFTFTRWLANFTLPKLEPNNNIFFQTFEADLVRLMKKGGWDGNESNSTQQWTFSGALFYSIVVITTIGKNGINHSISGENNLLLHNFYHLVLI